MNKKVILITGASSGIGKESAFKLLEQGHIVYCGARSIEKMEDLKQKGAHLIALDMTKHETLEQAVEKIVEEQSKIDVLFNNAGFGLYGSVEDVPIEDARYQFEVNLFGLARLTQLVLPHMRSQKSGTIINTSSMGGKIYMPLGAWYHATKHALEGWSDSLRLELKPFNIKVVIIEPGIIKTNFANIMQNKLKQVSNGGAYQEYAEKFINAINNNYSKDSGSPASVISNLVSNAVNSNKPKTRYAGGKFAKLMMFIRKWLGDNIFDKVVQSFIK